MTGPAPAASAIRALAAHELRLAARRGENLLVTLVIPVAVLAFFASVAVLPIPGRPVDFLVPGAIALGVVATAFVNLGIATAYERHYGVLKRLGGAPLPRGAIVAAKILAVVAIELVQALVLVAVAWLLLGWRPGPGASTALALAAVSLGTVAFAGLGLAMAGRLRAEATLAVANGLFLAFLLLGGIVLPVDQLPEPLGLVAAALPVEPLGATLRAALGTGSAGAGDVLRLVAWALAGGLAGLVGFRSQ